MDGRTGWRRGRGPRSICPRGGGRRPPSPVHPPDPAGARLNSQPAQHPRVEPTDVVLAGHQHAPVGVRPGAHGRLGAPTGGEVLGVDPVEQFHQTGQVLSGLHHRPVVEPVALHEGALGGYRVHPVHDHVVGHQVYEHLGPLGHRLRVPRDQLDGLGELPGPVSVPTSGPVRGRSRASPIPVAAPW